MKKLYTYLAAILLIAGGTLWFYHANAKVCFLANNTVCGDETGTSNTTPYPNTGTHEYCCDSVYIHTTYWHHPTYGEWDLSDPGTCKLTNECPEGSFSANTCPMDTRYSHCCPKAYYYKQACPSPLVVDTSKSNGGKCGHYYACKCNDNYQYYMGKNSSNVEGCTNGNGYFNEHASVSGDPCSYTTYEGSNYVTEYRYEKCECLHSLYPYKTDAECEVLTHGTSHPSGEQCTNSDGITSYKSCTCDAAYTKFAQDCPYGYNVNDYCMENGRMKVKNCCNCSSTSYPYDENPEGNGSVRTAEECGSGSDGCGGRWKATECETGYRIENGRCTKGECYDALKAAFVGNGSYAVYNGTEEAVPGVDNLVVANDISVRASDLDDKNVMSSAYYVYKHIDTIPDDDLRRNVAEKCPTTYIPEVTFEGSIGNQSLNLMAVTVKGANEYEGTNVKCLNCTWKVDYPNIILKNNKFELAYEAGAPNEQNLKVVAKDLKIYNQYQLGGTFLSYNYDFDIESHFDIKNERNNAIIQIGGMRTAHIDVDMQYLTVRGVVLFKYADLYPTNKVVVGGGIDGTDADGINCSLGYTVYGNSPQSSFYESFLELYDTDLYLHRSDWSEHPEATLYMCAASAVGYPIDDPTYPSGNSGNFNGTSRIITEETLTPDNRKFVIGMVHSVWMRKCNLNDQVKCYNRVPRLIVLHGQGIGDGELADLRTGPNDVFTTGENSYFFYGGSSRNRNFMPFTYTKNGTSTPVKGTIWKFTHSRAGENFARGIIQCSKDGAPYGDRDNCWGANTFWNTDLSNITPITSCSVNATGHYKCVPR